MMKRRKSPKYYLSLLFLCIFLSPSPSQVQVERSKDKALIRGVPYYLHSVKKGETTYSISKAYGIAPEQLVKYNTGTRNGIKENQILRIPVSLVPPPAFNQVPQAQQGSRDEKEFIYHRLQQGETIYSLSKKYNVTIEEILKSNPGIDISKLPLDSEIAIPRKDILMTNQQVTGPPDSKYYYHRVVKGETLASIAKRYGLTLRSLRRENRDARFPQVGDYLKIPGMKPVQVPVESPVAEDTVSQINEEKVTSAEKPAGWTPVTSLNGSVNLAVMLPFYIDENSQRFEIDSSQVVKGKKSYKVINRPDDWIYPRSVGFVELYEGILLAADTLRSLGLDINIHTFDIRNDTIELTRLIQAGRFDNIDIIIGPVHSRNLSIIAGFAGPRGIPVVSPVPLLNNSVLANNPLLFIANPSLEVAQKCIAVKTLDYPEDNILLIHDDSTRLYETSGFENMLLNELQSKIPASQIKLRDFLFYSKSVFGTDSINRLGKALSDKNSNLVIIDSEDSPVMSESITDIHTLSRKYDIKVFGYPNMRYLNNLDPKIFFDLGLMIYSPYWIDYSKNNVKHFLSDFIKKFRTQPSEMSYAWQGYDIVYYFLSGLSLHGKGFLDHPEIHNPELLQTQFDFQRGAITDGFENKKLFLIRYSNNYQLELIDGTLSSP